MSKRRIGLLIAATAVALLLVNCSASDAQDLVSTPKRLLEEPQRIELASIVVSAETEPGDRVTAVPSLDQLAADWMETGTLCNYPSVNNFVGGLKCTPNLTAFQCLTFPPYAQSAWSSELLLDGKTLNAYESRWYPYQVCRRVTVDGVAMESIVRLPFEQPGVLTRLTLENRSSESRTLNLAMNGYGRVRLYETEQWRTWGNLRPGDGDFAATVSDDGKTLTLADSRSPAVTVCAFVKAPTELKATGERGDVKWNLSLAPGERAVIEYAHAVGQNRAAVATMATRWAVDFAAEFKSAKVQWERRWQAAFKPGNKDFSGHFPTLITDDPKIRRVYYHGALVPLLMCRTSMPLNNRCFVTCGPEWANTLIYFWDAGMWANTWAMLEPVAMKEHLAKWLTLDHHNCYAIDCLSGKGAGPWYAANDWSIFRCIEAYVGVTGDRAFLQHVVDGRTVLQRLDEMATFFEKRPLMKDSRLADYGGPENLLECSPSYIQGVPSLNAANVYMLRRTAAFHEQAGNAARAAALCTKADELLPAVMALYEVDQGVWNAVNRVGKKVPIRHCFDYIVIGQALENDLTPQMKSEMNAFVERELRTKSWMRAMSLKDPAAAQSDRPDHGPLGSYDGWPPLTMDVMCRFGAFAKATAFLRAVEPVTHEGPFAQSHEFIGPNSRGRNPVVRIAHRGGQDANEGCGAAFVEVVICSFFGCRPDLSEGELKLLAPAAPRGFTGELRHLPFRGELYTIVCQKQGVVWRRE